MSDLKTCPFNESHKIVKARFLTHIFNKCEAYNKKKHLYAQCQYDSLHFIIK